jgi:hypothetical protein
MKLGNERAERWRLYLIGFGTWEPVNRFGMACFGHVYSYTVYPVRTDSEIRINKRSERAFNFNLLSPIPVFTHTTQSVCSIST